MSVQCGYPSPVHSIPRNSAKDGDKKDGNWDESFDATAAFLGPNLWDKTVPYNDDFKMEYMDLDEFFTENGIAVPNHEMTGANRNPHPQHNHHHHPHAPHHNHHHHHHPNPHHHQQQQQQQQHQQQHQQEQDHHHSPHHQSPHPSHQQTSLPPTPVTPTPPQLVPPQPKPTPPPDSTSTPPTPPTSPFEKPVQIKEALATSPGQERFDPINHTFSEDELKPQPMVKKSKKQLVPNDMKDEKYWARRKKNNMAAKRSRDARRVKENQIAMRASFLERENTTLRKEIEVVQRENSALKEKLAKYERC